MAASFEFDWHKALGGAPQVAGRLLEVTGPAVCSPSRSSSESFHFFCYGIV